MRRAALEEAVRLYGMTVEEYLAVLRDDPGLAELERESTRRSKSLALQCLMTIRTSPSLVRLMTGLECVEYDEGSVMSCVKRYMEAKDCGALAEAIKSCDVVAFPETTSADCK